MPCGVGITRELVRQPDVHVPVGGLGQLGQLRRLGRAQVPHAVGCGQGRAGRRSPAPPRRTPRRAGRPRRRRRRPAWGSVRRSAKTRPVSTRSGLKTRWKSRPAVKPGALAPAWGGQRVARGADRERGLVARPACRGAASADDRRVAASIQPKSGTPSRVDEQRHHHHDRVALGHRRRGVGRRRQQPARHDLGELRPAGGPRRGRARCRRSPGRPWSALTSAPIDVVTASRRTARPSGRPILPSATTATFTREPHVHRAA